jgi:hypothetical protein
LDVEGTGTAHKNVGKATRRCEMNAGEPGGTWGVSVERSGLMGQRMTERERDGGPKADGETAAGLRGGGTPRAASSAGGRAEGVE